MTEDVPGEGADSRRGSHGEGAGSGAATRSRRPDGAVAEPLPALMTVEPLPKVVAPMQQAAKSLQLAERQAYDACRSDIGDRIGDALELLHAITVDVQSTPP